MKKQKLKNRWIAYLLIFSAVVSALSQQPLTAAAAAGDEEEAQERPLEAMQEETEEGTVVLEGITLNRSSLVMKTGEQKTLTAALLPENTTEKPEITWSSDDPEVAQVTGLPDHRL